MRQALLLAERGRGSASPNPAVGALIVAGERVIGSGFHARAGESHAEVLALRDAGDAAAGATMYVTLAPCTRQGRTPACVDAVIDAGVARVVFAQVDPHPDETHGSADVLRRAGIEVSEGVLAAQAAQLIENFTVWATTGRPLVTLKLALTLDGRAAAADGSSRWVTGPEARADVHRLRAWADAILVGVGTVVADDPSLTARDGVDASTQPLRVILDPSGRIPLDSRVLADGGKTVVATTTKAPESVRQALADRGLILSITDGRVDLEALLDTLGKEGVTDLLCEGGPSLAGDMLERGLVDRVVFYLAPKLLGPDGLAGIGGIVAPSIADARGLRITDVRMIGSDVRVEAVPER